MAPISLNRKASGLVIIRDGYTRNEALAFLSHINYWNWETILMKPRSRIWGIWDVYVRMHFSIKFLSSSSCGGFTYLSPHDVFLMLTQRSVTWSMAEWVAVLANWIPENQSGKEIMGKTAQKEVSSAEKKGFYFSFCRHWPSHRQLPQICSWCFSLAGASLKHVFLDGYTLQSNCIKVFFPRLSDCPSQHGRRRVAVRNWH